MLPLYVDTTGSNVDSFKRRAQILEDFGYDLKLLFIDVTLSTAQKRAKERAEKPGGRLVPPEVVADIYSRINRDRGAYSRTIPDSKIIRNNDGEISPAFLKKLRNEAFRFYNSSIKNPIGKKVVDFMKKKGYKYYNQISEDERIENGFIELQKDMHWYRN